MENLHPQIVANIAKSEKDGGVKTSDLKSGDVVKVQTVNTLYTITRGEDGFTIHGHQRFCPNPIKAQINGSTWGGSMIKVGWIGIGMHLEFHIPGFAGRITTSPIRSVEVTCAA